MSSTVENYHYVVYNEFEKPPQFAEPPQNLFGYKKALQNTAPDIDSPQNYVAGENQCDGGQVPDNGTAQTNLTELAELITSAASKQGRDGNVNVYNKCVFFVNSYSNGDLQDASKLLGQLSGPHPKPRDPPPDYFKIPEGFAENVSQRLNQNVFNDVRGVTHPISGIGRNLESIVSSALTNLNDDPIIVSSDSEDEYIAKNILTTEPNQKLYFVDKNDLKPILTPNVMPGVYKKLTPEPVTSTEFAKENVITESTEKSGAIVKTEDFQASYATDCDAVTATEDFIENAIIEEDLTPEVVVPPPSSEPVQMTSTIDSNQNDEANERLKHLAYDILKLPFTSNCVQFNCAKNELIYRNPSSKKKIIYRIVKPADLQLQLNTTDACQSIKLGNPSFIQCITNSSPSESAPFQFSVQQQNDVKMNDAPKRPRGRPRKVSRKRAATTNEQMPIQFAQNIATTPPQTISPLATSSPTSRTRYGRVSRLPQYIENNFKISSEATPLQMPGFDTILDADYKCNSSIEIQRDADTDEHLASKRERNIPPEFRCSGCNKTYLGKNKMIRHFGAFPDHFKNAGVDEMIKDTSLYTFLVKKVQQENLCEDQRITLLLNELTDFVNQLQSRRSQLVTNNSAFYFVNSVASKIIGASEGHYGVNLDALSAPPPTMTEPALILPPPPRLDYNLSISLDDTLADAKLNLSENMIASDDSLLRTVDDLVKEGIKNLTGDVGISGDPVPSVIHYDHASDNAVEAVHMKETQPPPILDLSLDLFQFNSN